MEFQEMDLSAVTFMLAEAILRKIGTEVTHHSVTGNLRDHAGSSDAEAEAIAIDDSGLRKRKGNNGQAIDQYVIRRRAKRFDSDPHGPMARAQNIDSIDLDRIDNTNTPRDLRTVRELKIDFFPQLRRKLFGIVQTAMTKFLRKNHRGRDDWTGQRAAASFINPGNLRHACGTKFFLIAKSAAPIHAVLNLGQFRPL
jgi:hypothetical protein